MVDLILKRFLFVFAALILILTAITCTDLYAKVAGKQNREYVSNLVALEISQEKVDSGTVPALKTEKLEVVEISESNSVVMDQVFTDESVNVVMRAMQKLSENSPKDKTLYLVLNSPGGSVDAGLAMISFIKALPQKVSTISIFSASMSFQTSQNLGERLVLPHSTVMSHRAKFGIQGEAPGEMFSRLKWIMSQLDELDQIAANRMQISFADYRTLIADEYWSYGRNAVNEKSADRLILARCARSLTESTKVVEVPTMMGVFKVEVSKCPLIPGIISVQSPNDKVTLEQLQYVKTMFVNRKEFVNDFVVTDRWSKFQKIY